MGICGLDKESYDYKMVGMCISFVEVIVWKVCKKKFFIVWNGLKVIFMGIII